jgi:hypothetical protein
VQFIYFISGRAQVQSEINDFKLKLQLAKETIASFKSEISRVQKERGEEANVSGSFMYSTP